MRLRWLFLSVLIGLVVALGGFVAPDLARAAPPFCGDNVRAGPEDCDGTDAPALHTLSSPWPPRR